MQIVFADSLVKFYGEVTSYRTFSDLYQSSLQKCLNQKLAHLQKQNFNKQKYSNQQNTLKVPHEKQQIFEIWTGQYFSHFHQAIYFCLFYHLLTEKKLQQMDNFMKNLKISLKNLKQKFQYQIYENNLSKIDKLQQCMRYLQYKIDKQCKIDWLFKQFYKQFSADLDFFTQILCSKESELGSLDSIKKDNYTALIKILNVKCFFVDYSSKNSIIYGEGEIIVYIGYRQQKYYITDLNQYDLFVDKQSLKAAKSSSKGSQSKSSQKLETRVSQVVLQKKKLKQQFLSELSKAKALMLRNSQSIGELAEFKDFHQKKRNHDLLERA